MSETWNKAWDRLAIECADELNDLIPVGMDKLVVAWSQLEDLWRMRDEHKMSAFEHAYMALRAIPRGRPDWSDKIDVIITKLQIVLGPPAKPAPVPSPTMTDLGQRSLEMLIAMNKARAAEVRGTE